ncbi:hypothetical protein ABIA32_000524 [Streptacidiphilus sp. MAP12-20]|uniref:DUF2218 domain-containing protein n=1 Tax=Streptacidiphilus sp. MAP12-20 TaxID=3156299 RepID=UPI003519D6BB
MHSSSSHSDLIRNHFRGVAALLLRRRRPVASARDEAVRSVGRVRTPKSVRYGKQLCSHATWRAARAEWTEPEGLIVFPGGAGTCRITAEPECLVLTVEAADPAALAEIQRVLGGNVERFAARDGLTVDWTAD